MRRPSACWTGSFSSPSPRIGACFPTETCSRRKEQGVYYTADYIVNYLVSAALDPLWEQARTDLAKEHGVDLSSTAPPSGSFLTAMLTWLDGVTLCDPACGSGGNPVSVHLFA